MPEFENHINIQFESSVSLPPIIKVFGVGGGGSNAVNHMFRQGITGVEFVVCNTDLQALSMSPVPSRLQIGAGLTGGRGAGNTPEVGRNAAMENVDEIRNLLSNNTQMVFITAGMGGGTGTGAAPVIAQIAKELDILTVGIVTTPFNFEGARRQSQAQNGIDEMRKYVDSLIIINNDKVREHYGNLKLSQAFSHADNILTVAAKGIAELITIPGYMNVDFEDVKTIMKNSGVAIMGTGIAEGEDRAAKAVEGAINSPLLNDSEISGARNILLYISSGDEEMSMDEITEITDYIQQAAGTSADLIWGTGTDLNLGPCISVTVVATNFQSGERQNKQQETKIITMETPNDVVVNQVTNEPEITVFEKEPVQQTLTPIVQQQPVISPQTEQPIERITIPIDNDVFDQNEEEPRFPVNEMPQQQLQQQQVVLDINQQDPLDDERHIQQVRPLQEERKQTLRDFNFNRPQVNNLDEIEAIPAYARRGVNLAPENPSDEKIVSRFTLGENGEKKPEIRENNSFLHDNVD